MAQTPAELILDRAQDAVISIDQRGLITYWNESAERLFEIGRERAVGAAVADLVIPQRLRASYTEGIQRFLQEGVGPLLDRRTELTVLRGDGTEFPVEATISALRVGNEWMFTAFLHDVSARRAGERERERQVEELRRTLSGTERRFDAVVGSLADPVTIRDRENRIVYANRAALLHLGFDSIDELRATPPEDIMADYVVLGEDGKVISMEQIPSVRLLRGEAPEPLLIRTINRRTGAEQWNLLKAAPLLDDAGAMEATIMVIENVTEQRRAERASEFLAQASIVLASSLDYEQTLRNVAQLAVPDIVDWCAVDLLDQEGDRVPVAVAHEDPARLKLAEELRGYEPERLDPAQGLGLVLKTGRPALYPEITDQMLVEAAADERHLELLRAVGFRSAAIVPMRIGSRTLGAMTLVSAESGRVLGDADVALAEQIAARAAVAIENSRVYSERSMIAHTLQQSLLPQTLPRIPGYELASVYIPALQSAEVGGDFYDVWETGGSWMVAIGDVTGKGIRAAALTSLVRHTLRATAEFVSSPAELLARLDLTLKKQRGRSPCSAVCLRLDGPRITLAIGGHPLPIRITASGAHEIGEYGPLLGAFEAVQWRDIELELMPNSTLIVYTDGVTDALGRGGERYGLARLTATLDRCREQSAPEVIESLTDALRGFQVGEHADDTAVLALRRLPPGGQADRGEEAGKPRLTAALAS